MTAPDGNAPAQDGVAANGRTHVDTPPAADGGAVRPPPLPGRRHKAKAVAVGEPPTPAASVAPSDAAPSEETPGEETPRAAAAPRRAAEAAPSDAEPNAAAPGEASPRRDPPAAPAAPAPPKLVTWKDYVEQSRRPLVSLAFVTPFLLAYEIGVLWLGPQAMRNGADEWLRGLLARLDFGQYFLLPLATLFLLLGWHHLSRHPWRFSPSVLLGMALESCVWAFLLLIVWQAQATWFASWTGGGDPGPAPGASARSAEVAVANAPFGSPRLAAPSDNSGPSAAARADQSIPWARVIGYCGAGLYEELFFRVLLLWGLIGALWIVPVLSWARVAGAVLLTSLLFSAAHYNLVTPGGDALRLDTFVFRVTAGVFFSALMLRRGFGVTVGAHVVYDLLVEALT